MNRIVRTRVLTRVVLGIVAGLALSSQAVVWTWTGGGTTANWSEKENWDGALVPTNGDGVVLPSAATDTTTTMDVRGPYATFTTGANRPVGSTTSYLAYWIAGGGSIYDVAQGNGFYSWNYGRELTPAVHATQTFEYGGLLYMSKTLGDYADFALTTYAAFKGTNPNNKDTTETGVPATEPYTTFKVADLNGAGNVSVFVGHDQLAAGARPSWLSSWTATGKTTVPTSPPGTFDMYELSQPTAGAVGDSRGWLGYGGQLSSLTINQTTPGVTQTVNINQLLEVGSRPVFNVTAGNLIVNVNGGGVGGGGLEWPTASGDMTIPDGVTVNLNNAYFRSRPGTHGSGSLIIASGGKLAGVGTVGGTYDLTIAPGGTLEAGHGQLRLEMIYGNWLRWRGAISLPYADSELVIGTSQWKYVEPVSADTAISGEGILDLEPHNSNMTFGRFVDASKIHLEAITVQLGKNNFVWEAQTLGEDVEANPAAAAFKLEALQFVGTSTFKLTDTGSVDDDFVYIGELLGMSSTRRIDLNDVALLTDLSETALLNLLPYVTNTGTQGAPTVKSVQLGYGSWYWYLAPEGLVIPEIIPEPASLGVMLLGALALRRRA